MPNFQGGYFFVDEYCNSFCQSYSFYFMYIVYMAPEAFSEPSNEALMIHDPTGVWPVEANQRMAGQ